MWLSCSESSLLNLLFPRSYPEWYSQLQANATLYAHVVMNQPGLSYLRSSGERFDRLTVVRSQPLNLYRPLPRVHNRKNLISGEFGDTVRNPMTAKSRAIARFACYALRVVHVPHIW